MIKLVTTSAGLAMIGGLVVAAPAAAAAPAPPRPGTCWRMTQQQANQGLSYLGTRVACKFSHTMETAGAIVMPADIARSGRTSRRVALWSRYACSATVNTYTGFTSLAGRPGHNFPRVTYENFAGFAEAQRYVFLPTGVQWTAGARWVSCAAGSESAAPGKGDVLIARLGSVRGQQARLHFQRSQDGRFDFVAAPSIASSLTEGYPGDPEAKVRSLSACRALLGSTTPWLYNWDPLPRWRQGLTFAYCWHQPN